MKTFATRETRPAPAVSRSPFFTHYPIGPVQQEPQEEIRRILRSTGAQAKLTIGQPDDRYEQEADRFAEQVMRMSDPRVLNPTGEREGEFIQPKSIGEQITPLAQRQAAPKEREPIQANEEAVQAQAPVTQTNIQLTRNKTAVLPYTLSKVGGMAFDHIERRLCVIVETGFTINQIAKKLYPLLKSATQIDYPDVTGTQSATNFTEEQLAKSLLVYNKYYLGVPGFKHWKEGLRLPLPVLVDKKTGAYSIGSGLIVELASKFDRRWKNLLDMKSKKLESKEDIDLHLSMAEFIAGGIHPESMAHELVAMALRNALEAVNLIQEFFKFRYVKAYRDYPFRIALEFIIYMKEHQLATLAGQRPGMKIVQIVSDVLKSPPLKVTQKDKRKLSQAKAKLRQLKSTRADKRQVAALKRIYVKKARGGMRCMHMVYRGLGALISTTFSQDTLKKVLQTAGKRKSKNTMVHLMEAARAQGRAGPSTSVMYRRGKWHPDPERTVLALTESNLPGWYFVGMSLHGAYHSIILAIDKNNPAVPKIYLMDQFTKGFVNNVTGKLTKYMKKWKPSYGYHAKTKFWPIYPVSNTLIEIKPKRIFKI